MGPMGAAGQRFRPRVIDRCGGPQTFAELLDVPGVDERCSLRSAFGLMAIHGGGLEAMTDVVAATAAERARASYYAVLHPPNTRHHLPSARYDPQESPLLAGFLGHVDVVVSVHGYGREGSWTSLLVGGGNRVLAADIADSLRRHVAGYDVVDELERIPVELRGLSRRNPVNVPRGGGVQLELPPRVRGISPLSPPPGPDGLSAPTRALIDALVDVATRWTSEPG
jgi:phage replication-related protein YjqB (UPF0714/DUF867 family)